MRIGCSEERRGVLFGGGCWTVRGERFLNSKAGGPYIEHTYTFMVTIWTWAWPTFENV